MIVLKRILLLTIVYEIPWIIAICLRGISQQNPQSFLLLILWNTMMRLSRLTIVYCLFLMQYHNNSEYYKFLQATYGLRMYYCCCCCFKSMVRNEIEIEKKRRMNEMKSHKLGYDVAALEEDEKKEHDTLTDKTIPTLNSVIGDSFRQNNRSLPMKEEMKTNEASSRNIIQSLATIHESDKLDTKIKKYSQFKQNVKNEEKMELVRSRNVRHKELSENQDY